MLLREMLVDPASSSLMKRGAENNDRKELSRMQEETKWEQKNWILTKAA